MSRGEDVSKYFAAVIKNIATNSFALKKLIYLYLLKYAESEPDLSLLSINSFQKGCQSRNCRFIGSEPNDSYSSSKGFVIHQSSINCSY
jgi:hypothetical protein